MTPWLPSSRPAARRALACAIVLVTLLAAHTVAPPPAVAQAAAATSPATPAEQRTVFREAWARAGRGDHEALVRAIARLPDHLLTPYLEFELRRQRIADYDAASMSRFLARYRDWSFHARLERAWQRHLARSDQFDALRRHAPDTEDAEVRCLDLRDRLRGGEAGAELMSETRALWLSPVSRPTACDPLFAWWRRQGQPDSETAWQRFGLAVEAGELSLAGYLRRYLAPLDRPLAEGWLKMARRPASGLADARAWPDQARPRQLVAWGLHRLAGQDWASATTWLGRFESRMSFEDGEIAPVRRRIALFQAVDLDPGAVDTIDALREDWIDDQLLQWRLRVALINGDWATVLDSVQRMSAEVQLQGRWRYWRGRALAALGRPEAGLVLATLAAEPDYYGFLAALRTDQPLTLCSRELPADGDIQRRLMRDAEFARALELHRVGLNHDARWTWNRVSGRLRAAELEQAALLASAEGWHDRAIAALARAGATDAYPWRFPIVERERIERTGARHGVDPALVLGLMRAESAMQADARSSADARGLLQLVDGTARGVAARFGLPYRGPSDLYDPTRNLALGIAHLGELQQRFGGEFTRVAAAYNAGPNAAERWQQDRRGLPADIWIETLPYFETRDYVPRVLAFATVYEWQLQRSPSLLAQHVIGRSDAGRFACPEPERAPAGRDSAQ